MERHEPKIVVGVLVVVFVVVGLLFFSGSQTSTILSKVGAAIPYTPPADEPAPPEAGDVAGGPAAGGSGPGAAGAAQPEKLLIIRKGTLRLEVTDVAATVSRAAGVVTSRGGFVAGSTETGTAGDARAGVDYRIPADAWESTLAELRGLATVREQSISTEEVTGQVLDLGARIANLRATESALQAIMARATKIADVLEVQKQLTETRGQIEELTAQKAGLQDRAAFGSLGVTFQLPPKPTPTATPRLAPGWDPARDAELATSKLVRIGQKATTAGIWIAIVGLPILVALAIAIGLAWVAWRLVTRWRDASEARSAG
jgi:hypothetical protein